MVSNIQCALSVDRYFTPPRADLNAFDNFYKNSKSSIFWATEFFPSVMDARRELVFAPKAKEILSKTQELNIGHR